MRKATILHYFLCSVPHAVLVLPAAFNAQFMSFDLVSHLSYLVGRHGKVEPMSKCPTTATQTAEDDPNLNREEHRYVSLT